jgi:RNA polymerase sigma factor (sigma-70 family)
MEFNQEIIEAALGGGAELDRLLALVWPEAYRVAFGILHDRGLAEDAAQDACARIASKLATLKSAALFRTWMYKIAANRAISIGRARKATCNLEMASDNTADADPTERVDLYRALAALPLRQRAAVLLHYYAGLNSGEIAEACGFPPGSVRFYLMQARRTLRKALASDATFASDISSKEASHGC